MTKAAACGLTDLWFCVNASVGTHTHTHTHPSPFMVWTVEDRWMAGLGAQTGKARWRGEVIELSLLKYLACPSREEDLGLNSFEFPRIFVVY